VSDHAPIVEEDPLGPDRDWADLTPVIAHLLIAGTVLSFAAAENWAWAYIVGLVLMVIWVAGFVTASGTPRRWYRW
jgi:hypothetical protein